VIASLRKRSGASANITDAEKDADASDERSEARNTLGGHMAKTTFGLAQVEDGEVEQVIERTRYAPQDWENGDGLIEGRRLLADSIRFGTISLDDDGRAVFAADPSVTIGTVEGLDAVKQLMTAVEQGTPVETFPRSKIRCWLSGPKTVNLNTTTPQWTRYLSISTPA
jgi:hypothetical protein